MSDLPHGWRSVPISEVARNIRVAHTARVERTYELWSVPSFADGAPEVLTGGKIGSVKQSVEPGDVLLCKINPRINRVWQVGELRGLPQIASPEWINLRVDADEVIPKYLQYFLSAPDFRAWISGRASSATGSHARVKATDVLREHIALPLLGEQQRIVATLEDHLSRLDAADAYISTSQRRLERLLTSIVLTDQTIRSSAEVALRDILSEPLANGRSVPSREGGFPVLRLTALKTSGLDVAERKAGAWDASEAAPFLVRRGDYFVSRGNGSIKLVARGALLRAAPDPIAFPDTMVRFRVDKSVLDPEYLDLVWNSPLVRHQIEASARTTAGIHKVNQRQLESVRLPLPELADQRRFLAHVTFIVPGVAALAAAAERQSRRSTALRHALLAAAFSGRLTGRSSDLDVAEEMTAGEVIA